MLFFYKKYLAGLLERQPPTTVVDKPLTLYPGLEPHPRHCVVSLSKTH